MMHASEGLAMETGLRERLMRFRRRRSSARRLPDDSRSRIRDSRPVLLAQCVNTFVPTLKNSLLLSPIAWTFAVFQIPIALLAMKFRTTTGS